MITPENETSIAEPKCELAQKCKYEGACGSDVYIIPGYREEDMEHDNNEKFKSWVFDNHDTYKCFLPYDKCNHDAKCISNELKKEITAKSGSKPVDLIGLCFGGNIAMQYSADNPEGVNKLAIITSNDMSRVPSTVLSALKLKDVENAKKINYPELQQKIKADTFVYNCFSDRIIGGNPPHIEGSEVMEDIFCLHGQIKKPLKSIVERFLNRKKKVSSL